MQSPIRTSLIAAAVALSLFAIAGGASATDSVSQDVVEARQETQIWTTYALSPYLRANDIKVTVHGDTATLTGKVGEDVDKDLAKQIALGVNGIQKVDNQIVVTSDYEAPKASTDRTFGEFIDDASITTAVKSKLLWSKHAEGMSADVDVLRSKRCGSGLRSGKNCRATTPLPVRSPNAPWPLRSAAHGWRSALSRSPPGAATDDPAVRRHRAHATRPIPSHAAPSDRH